MSEPHAAGPTAQEHGDGSAPAQEQIHQDAPAVIEPPLSPAVRRTSALPSPLPALGELDMPEVQVSLVRPDGSMTTPRPEPAMALIGSPSARDSAPQAVTPANPTDYFSPDAVKAHAVTPAPSTDATLQPESFSRRSSYSTDLGSDVEADPLTRTSTVRSAFSIADDPNAFSSSAGASSESVMAQFAQYQYGHRPRTAPKRSMTDVPTESGSDFPSYPDQSFAALHHQVYPPSYHPSYRVRPSRSRRPSQSDAHAALHNLHKSSREHPILDRIPRTVGNTPIMSPTAMPSSQHGFIPLHSGSNDASSIPSPYLHPVQGLPPRETTRVTKEFDSSTGRKIINQYEIIDELGRGVHGKVKLARDLEKNVHVAIKIVSRYDRKRRVRLGAKADSPEDKVKKEIAILKKAVHPNVVGLYEVIDDPDLSKIYIVLEFCELQEVNWRADGASEIVLMEHRRLERERRGDSDIIDEAARANFMAIAERRRAARAKDKHPLSRIASESDFWSLEFAASDDESDDTNSLPMRADSPVATRSTISLSPETMKRIRRIEDNYSPTNQASSTMTLSAEAMRRRQQVEDMFAGARDVDLDENDLPFDPNATTTQTSFDNAKAFVEEAARRRMSEYNFGSDERRLLFRQLDRLQDSQQEGGEPRGRQRSIAESVSSHLTELVEEELDEEHRYVPTMTLAEIRSAFRDALLGLEYLHYHGIVHRDIKPANLLRKQDHRVKISDFGVSYLGKPVRDHEDESSEASDSESGPDLEEETELAKTVGTPAFYAPELCSLDFSPDHPTVSNQLDVWALGVTLYCLLYARLPFTADNEFVLMRRIAEDDVFISRKRLKAVEKQANSRPTSNGPLFRNTRDRRLPTELLYDDIDADLFDLLKRILEKNPAKRITVKDIKHHPWVLRDIDQPRNWIEDSDPSKWQNGKRIEISRKEVEQAVIPLKVLERVKSLAKKAAGAFMFPGSSSRRRGQSSAASSDAGSSQSDGSRNSSKRTASHKIDESLAAALKASREREHPTGEHQHPLSQSVTASPEISQTDLTRDDGFLSNVSSSEQLAQPQTRPNTLSRQGTFTSTSGSVKTVRQSDVEKADQLSAELAADPSASSMSTIFGEAGRSIMRSLRRASDYSQHRSASSSHSATPDDLRGKPSLAISTTSAMGHVNLPAALLNPSPGSSSMLDHSLSQTSVERTGPASGPASLNVTRNHSPAPNSDSTRLQQPTRGAGSYASPRSMMQAAPEEDWVAADRIMARRRALEEEELKRRSRPASSMGLSAHSPSREDEQDRGRATLPRTQSSFLELSAPPFTPSQPATPSQVVSSVSSEDRLSPSASYPSLPSAVSADTSVDIMVDRQKDDNKSVSTQSSGATARGDSKDPMAPAAASDQYLTPSSQRHANYGDLYTIDTEGDDDDSDEEEDFLVMSRSTSRVPHRHQASHQSSPLSRNEPSRPDDREL